jgi:hypothetical protein
MAKAVRKETPHNLPPKKTLKVAKSDTHSLLFKIVYHEGGNVPKEVDGDFNSKSAATSRLKEYLSYKENNKSYLEYVRDKENAENKDEVRV